MYTNTTNIFNNVPYDIIQYEINTYLTAEDRANFNAVLEPTERVYKKFPIDFTAKHFINMFISRQNLYAYKLTSVWEECNKLEEDDDYPLKKNLLKPVKRYTRFISSWKADLVFQYNKNAKDSAIRELHSFLDTDYVMWKYIDYELEVIIEEAIYHIKKIPFLRHISLLKN